MVRGERLEKVGAEQIGAFFKIGTVTFLRSKIGDCPLLIPEWGQGKYVDAVVQEIERDAVKTAGSYEVRLHDQYPTKSYHVACRQKLTVK